MKFYDFGDDKEGDGPILTQNRYLIYLFAEIETHLWSTDRAKWELLISIFFQF